MPLLYITLQYNTGHKLSSVTGSQVLVDLTDLLNAQDTFED